MAQQGQWKAPALAATFSSNAGYSGTAWGAARPPLQNINSSFGFGMGFGQPQMHGMPSQQDTRRTTKRKASEDENMEGSSPPPEQQRRIRYLSSGCRVTQTVQQQQQQNQQQQKETQASAEVRKRTRMEDTKPKDVTLDKLLEPLEEKDLRSLLDMLVAQNPGLATQVRDLVPKPTVNSACSQLVRLERRLLAAFPYNKSGPLADDYTYHRVRPALEELRDTIVMYLDHFTHYGLVSSRSTGTAVVQADNALTHPAEWFDLLAQATDIAMRMPKWDRREHNEIRRDTLRLLADGWLRAIMATARWSEEGHIVGRDMVSQWGYQLDHFYQNSGEPSLFQPPVQVFQQSFGQYCGPVVRGVSSHLPVETTPVPSL